MRHARRGTALASFAVALLLACSTRPAGLELIVATDLNAPDDYDTLHLLVSQEGTSVRDDIPFTEPGTVTLPATFAIAAGSLADQEAIIDVSLLKAGVIVVERQAQVQVPKDRVAELTLVLGRKCVGVMCGAGTTCDPQPDAGAGACVSVIVDAVMLPTFTPGDVDAAAVAVATGGGSSSSSSGSASSSGSGSGSGSGGSSSSSGSGSSSGGPIYDASSDAPNDRIAMIPDATGGHDASMDVVIDDVVVRDVVTETAPADACVPTSTTENCTNGIDDNCNGKVDCADVMCAAYTCTAVPPTGWMGHALLWTGGVGATAPTCPVGYQTIDANAGPTGTADSCSCTCASSGEMCSAGGTFYADQTCNMALACASVTLASSGTSACTALPTNNCGSGGSFAVAAAVPAPSGGSCAAHVTKTPGAAPSWMTSARVCSWPAPPDVPSGCSVAGDQCVPPNPGTFGPTACVYQSADTACPAAYPTKTLLYTGEADSRGCGSCTCSGAPTGGMCAGSISIWDDQNGGCGGTPGATYVLGLACLAYSGMLNDPGYAQANFTVTPGTCSVTAQPTPTGGVTGTGPTTVCCQ